MRNGAVVYRLDGGERDCCIRCGVYFSLPIFSFHPDDCGHLARARKARRCYVMCRVVRDCCRWGSEERRASGCTYIDARGESCCIIEAAYKGASGVASDKT